MAPHPLMDTNQAVRLNEQPRSRASVPHRRCILVVEDDAATREILGMLLDDEGYRAVLVADGAAALCYLRANPPPCCILLDVWMPIMGGLAFRLVQQAVPHLAVIPVIVVSAHRRGPWTEGEFQVDGYLEKPFTPDQLLVLVEQVAH